MTKTFEEKAREWIDNQKYLDLYWEMSPWTKSRILSFAYRLDKEAQEKPLHSAGLSGSAGEITNSVPLPHEPSVTHTKPQQPKECEHAYDLRVSKHINQNCLKCGDPRFLSVEESLMSIATSLERLTQKQ